MPQKDERANSGFRAFWGSLPGVLTGTAAVIAAVGTLAAVFTGGDGSTESPTTGAVAGMQAAATPGAGREACLDRYFEGIPRDRVGTAEAGSENYDVIKETQPKVGTIGMRFTDGGHLIGAIRFAFFPESRVFKIESIADARCRPVEDYENPATGDKRVLQDSGTVRLRLAGGYYDLTTIAWGSAIRVRFVAVVP